MSSSKDISDIVLDSDIDDEDVMLNVEVDDKKTSKKRQLMLFVPVLVFIVVAILTYILINANIVKFESGKPKVVILVSLDGFRKLYLSNPAFHSYVPTIKSMADNNLFSSLQPVYPSKTFPNHYSIVTGLYPESHGIVGNQFYDPDQKRIFTMQSIDSVWYGGEPIWNTVHKKSLKSGCIFWVGSFTEINGDVCDYALMYEKTVTIMDRMNYAMKLIDFPPSKRPSLITLYFDTVDTAGHTYGVDDIVNVGNAMKQVDDGIKYLLEELEKRSHTIDPQIIIVSDHGMANVAKNRAVNVDAVTVGLKDCLIYSDVGSPVASFYPKNQTCQRSIKEELQKLKNISIYEKSHLSVPARYHYSQSPRIAPIFVEASMGYYVTDTLNDPYFYIGQHGWDNTNEEMQSIFIAKGSLFNTTNKINSFPNLEIYNLICELLNIDPADRAPNNGTDILKNLVNKQNN